MMGERYEYRFHIDAFTPASLPMAHLAEYMAALAAFLGQRERVHFLRLEGGSTVLVQEIEVEAAPKVRERLEGVRRGDGPADAAARLTGQRPAAGLYARGPRLTWLPVPATWAVTF